MAETDKPATAKKSDNKKSSVKKKQTADNTAPTPDAESAASSTAMKPRTTEPAGGAQPYVVLARKYRPETFTDLIGQEAMVTTLRNAFATDRIAQGYMLTGVRGVGKTTTARILARALNYAKSGTPNKPTIELDGLGEHCAQILQSNHPDVLEMDAASNTGVDNVREIIESARYRPLTARYKVFIIDEVHMLSKGAFNALLKTLEEPPEHVKFIFATTEIRKVPVTVLSRCQRFDLRRVDIPDLVSHFTRIATTENAVAEENALRLIARAAEGSVRDGLSILDQAIAMGSGTVTGEAVRAMLGLADRGRIFDVLEKLLAGKTAETLDLFEALHLDGADPVQVLKDLSETVHAVSRAQFAGVNASSSAMSADEQRRASDLAKELSIPLLARIWQMLLKGIDEASRAPNPQIAAEMVLIRIAHTRDLPTPDEIIKAMGPDRATVARSSSPDASPSNSQPSAPPPGAIAVVGGGGGEITATGSAAAERVARAPQTAAITSFAQVLALCSERRDAKLRVHLEEHVSLVSFAPGHIEIFPLEGAPKGLAGTLGEKLSNWTGSRWVVSVGRAQGQIPIGEAARAERAAEIAEIKKDPAVAAVLSAFPGATITDIRDGVADACDQSEKQHHTNGEPRQ